MAHRFGGVPTYRSISAKKGTNERRYTMKKNINPVKLRDAISNKKLSVTSVKVFIDDIAREYPPD